MLGTIIYINSTRTSRTQDEAYAHARQTALHFRTVIESVVASVRALALLVPTDPVCMYACMYVCMYVCNSD